MNEQLPVPPFFSGDLAFPRSMLAIFQSGALKACWWGDEGWTDLLNSRGDHSAAAHASNCVARGLRWSVMPYVGASMLLWHESSVHNVVVKNCRWEKYPTLSPCQQASWVADRRHAVFDLIREDGVLMPDVCGADVFALPSPTPFYAGSLVLLRHPVAFVSSKEWKVESWKSDGLIHLRRNGISRRCLQGDIMHAKRLGNPRVIFDYSDEAEISLHEPTIKMNE